MYLYPFLVLRVDELLVRGIVKFFYGKFMIKVILPINFYPNFTLVLTIVLMIILDNIGKICWVIYHFIIFKDNTLLRTMRRNELLGFWGF